MGAAGMEGAFSFSGSAFPYRAWRSAQVRGCCSFVIRRSYQPPTAASRTTSWGRCDAM